MTAEQIVGYATALAAVLAGAAALIGARYNASSGVRANEQAARRDEAEQRRDTIADRDELIDQLQQERDDLKQDNAELRARSARLEADLEAERAHSRSLEDQIYRGDPPPPRPRPTRPGGAP